MSATPSSTSTASWFASLKNATLVRGVPAKVSEVASDSRNVIEGGLFVAVPGFEVDGHNYLEAALRAGANAVIVQEDRRSTWEPLLRGASVAVVAVPDSRIALAQAAAGQYDKPARKLGTVGVTGTDGKTTSVHVIAHVLEATGRPAGYMSSVAFWSAGEAVPNDTHMTTVESPVVQRHLAEMVGAGRHYAVLEASSHGLGLHRLDECEFDVGVFTSLARDHLDFHGTMEEYQAAKGRLFEMLGESVDKGLPKAAILNADDLSSEYFRKITQVPVVTYGLNEADVTARSIVAEGFRTRFELLADGELASVDVGLAGRFNVYNCLAAAAVAVSQGVPLEDVANALASFPSVPGRMQQVDAGQKFRVVIDIASTEAALQRILETLRPLTESRLCAVFGCAGERDPARRTGMGRVSGELADFVVLTNEDPRREDPAAIIDQIAQAAIAVGKSDGKDLLRIPDRRAALQAAFEWAREGDTVLLAGKANEPSIIIGEEHHPWDEAAVARELLGGA